MSINVFVHAMFCFLGALLCGLGFISAIVVSTLDKIGMRQLGLDGTIQEESRKVVFTWPFFLIVLRGVRHFRSEVYVLKYREHLGSGEKKMLTYKLVLSIYEQI